MGLALRSSSDLIIDTFSPAHHFFVNGASDTSGEDNGMHKSGERN